MRLCHLGPVFVSECVTTARRWQTYAGRVAFLAILLLSLTVVWVVKVPFNANVVTLSQLAGVGEVFFYAIAGTQLALVLLAAPAYTASAICLDKARGTLAHVLVTDLSSAEIVLGKLGSRLLPVLGMVVAGLPILALAILLGGIDPQALFGSFLVTLGVGVAGCALALALSVWGNKPHEVMLGTYAVLILWLLALFAVKLLSASWGINPSPVWLEKSNPFWLSFAPYVWPQSVAFDDYLLFLAGCGGFAAVLTLLAALTLRRAALPKVKRRAPPRRFQRWLPRIGPSLDFNPVLWREWHWRQRSRWVRIVWVVYVVLGLGASVLALSLGGPIAASMCAFVNAFLFSIGLLLVSVTSVTSLFEERVRGSLDVLLATPLPTSKIVWGKWWGTYRTAVWVTVLPTLLACCRITVQDVCLHVGLLFVLLLAYGAAVTSLGLALATWIRRFGMAVAISIVIFVLLAGGPVLILLLLLHSGNSQWAQDFTIVSPWFGPGEMTFEIGSSQIRSTGAAVAWAIVYALAAFALALATRVTFDRCLGRIEGRVHLRRVPPARRRVGAPKDRG